MDLLFSECLSFQSFLECCNYNLTFPETNVAAPNPKPLPRQPRHVPKDCTDELRSAKRPP